MQREKQIAGGFPDCSCKHQSSKENDPPGRTRHFQEAEGGGILRSGEPRTEVLPRNSCAAEPASTFGWEDNFLYANFLAFFSHEIYQWRKVEKKIIVFKMQTS